MTDDPVAKWYADKREEAARLSALIHKLREARTHAKRCELAWAVESIDTMIRSALHKLDLAREVGD